MTPGVNDGALHSFTRHILSNEAHSCTLSILYLRVDTTTTTKRNLQLLPWFWHEACISRWMAPLTDRIYARRQIERRRRANLDSTKIVNLIYTQLSWVVDCSPCRGFG